MEEESIRIGPDSMEDESIHVTSNHDGSGSGGSSKTSLTAAGHKSVSFAAGTRSSPDNKKVVSPNRVAFLRKKLQDSFQGDASFQKSWGGALNLAASAAMNDSSNISNSSSSDDSDEDSFGAEDAIRSLPMANDASENFRARARRESVSFNMSFMNIGLDLPDDLNGDDDDRLMGNNSRRRNGNSSNVPDGRRQQVASARGSIFVIADEKFANTRVVQVRLEKAAKKLQRFLRRSLLVLHHYNKERIYLQGELEDTEHRRKEELSDIRKWIQEEQDQFRLELELENQISPEDWDAYQREQDELRQQVAEVKADNKAIKEEGKALLRENDQLKTVDPEREAERARLEKEVEKLTKDIEDWERIQSHYGSAVAEANKKMEIMAEKRKAKRAERKKIEKTIKKIVVLLEEQQAEENPKLLAKVIKLKTKRELKIHKLKEQTAQGQIQIPQAPTQEQGAAPEAPRRKQRKSKKSQVDEGLPELETMNTTQNQPAAETQDQSQEDTRKASKKESKKDKKKKKKDKDKDKWEEELELQRKKVEGDATLMMIYAAEQKKKEQKAASKQEMLEVAKVGSENRRASALMSLITD